MFLFLILDTKIQSPKHLCVTFHKILDILKLVMDVNI